MTETACGCFFTEARRAQDPPGLIIFLARGAFPGVRLLSAANLETGLARSLSKGLARPRSMSLAAGGLSPGLAAGLPGVLPAGLAAAVLAADRALSRALSRGMTLVLALSAAAAVEADLVVTLGLPRVAFPGIIPKFLSCKWK